MNKEETKLAELLENAPFTRDDPENEIDWPDMGRGSAVEAAMPQQKSSIPEVGFTQWSAMPNDQFRPSGPRRERLEAGVYEVSADNMGIYFQKIKVFTDSLIEIDDEISHRVLGSMRKFWASKAAYLKRGILYKRGILLWGPAGSGKTSIIALLTQELIRKDGLVLLCKYAQVTSDAISVFRRIEPERNIIVVVEDIDEIVQHQGEHTLLALLDGENQVDNVVMLATTNYPERLGARIINRPSRFDERIMVDMPNSVARERYLKHVTKTEDISDDDLAQWVIDTDGLSVAHLRELVVAVFCLQQPYEEVLSRLKSMQFQLKAIPEFKRSVGAGFGTQPAMQAGQTWR